MSLLETFLILFKSDASDVEKGSKQAKHATDELKNSLLATDVVSQMLGRSFSRMAFRAASILTSAFSAVGIISGLRNVKEYTDTLGETAGALGIAVEELNAWGDAAKMSGGSTEGFIGSVQTLTASLSEFATKGKSRAAPFFKALGIAMVDSHKHARAFYDVLPELAQAFEHLSKQEAVGLGQKIGLDIGTIMLLQRGRKSVEDLVRRQKELGVTTAKSAKIAGDFNDVWDDLTHTFRISGIEINNVILPPLAAILSKITDLIQYLRRHKDFLIGFFISLALAITRFLIPAIAALVVAIAPVLGLTAALATVSSIVALIYDDIQAFRKGHKSLIGELLKAWPQVADVIRGARSALKNFKDDLTADPSKVFDSFIKSIQNFRESALTTLSSFFEDLFKNPEKAWLRFRNAISDIISVIFQAIPMLQNAWNVAAQGIDYVTDKILGAIREILLAYEKIKGFLGFSGSDLSSKIEVINKTLTLGKTSPLNSVSTSNFPALNKAVANNTSVNIARLAIETQATQTDEIARSISEALENQMRQTLNAYSSGVMI